MALWGHAVAVYGEAWRQKPGPRDFQAPPARLPGLRAGARAWRGARVEVDRDLEDAKQPTCTVDEFEMYAWPKDASGKPNKETPVDMFNHSMDCLRYLCLGLANVSKGIYM